MPGPLHEGILALISADPLLAIELFCQLSRVPIPIGRPEIVDGTLIAYSFKDQPREIRVDRLIILRQAHLPGSPVRLAVPFEAQLGLDYEKRFRLLEYIAAVRRDYRCSADAVVFAPSRGLAESIRGLFDDEPKFCPLIAGPDAIPMMTDPDQALARPSLALLSAVAHADSEFGHVAALLAAWVLHHIAPPRRRLYMQMLMAALPEGLASDVHPWLPAEQEEWIPSEFEKRGYLYNRLVKDARKEGRQQGLEEGLQQGLQQGDARGVLAGLRRALTLVLRSRGLEPTRAQQARIDACESRAQLEEWLLVAEHVTRVSELFRKRSR